ncbi:hypothetical protein PGT21_033428 [Puccinia graminis f. sp. tritici]|uniref:Uncharacterized protein n=2 Tax=Puccinia graminis f. sp. tritici TaxID=56615 RepID=E3JTJ6_PUCGT|nr:uncharacterized protein PGTG_01914 [Puccinia graminis f. sp. tritici CRL 75-36-700-3]KAA1100202.1 hypothetical protein PGT21_031584 [Puccinia graminis f. sp. tritici]EFP75321.1 hypothetical protein PGTG_01914 [Puccinia graminis f. sp. tritici CRL 75-36-700-3]KAA1118203.1 hypothetical protein PGT21_033428 [Puccinia graminis f. sp. tritici]KAA1120632.1 hypothetical protein PGTUg99_013769 [Puccinia graminis f. sp. tritici]KAA1121253.1 hypothetical protein PGTUg99_028890 [Puccinia graminis f. s
MLHLIRTLFSLTLVLAFTVVAYPSQSALLQNAPKGLGKRFQSIRPEASAPRPWVKTARDFLQEAPQDTTAQRLEKRSIQPRSFSKIRRRVEAGIATSRQTTGLSNPRPWVQKDEVISSMK